MQSRGKIVQGTCEEKRISFRTSVGIVQFRRVTVREIRTATHGTAGAAVAAAAAVQRGVQDGGSEHCQLTERKEQK